MTITAPTIIISNYSTCQLHFFFFFSFFLPCHPAPSQFSQPGWSQRAETEPAPKYRTRQAAWSKNTNSYQQPWWQFQRSLHSNLTKLIVFLKAFVNGAILVVRIMFHVRKWYEANSKEEMFVQKAKSDMTMDWLNVSSCKTAASSQEKKKKQEQLAG